MTDYYIPVKRGLPGFSDAGQVQQYGPSFATSEEASQWIYDRERREGCEPGCDSGFGGGSGFVVEEHDTVNPK